MSLFNQIKGFALRKGYAFLRKKGAPCPECGELLDLPVEMPSESEGVSCAQCGWSGDVWDLMQGGDEQEVLRVQPAKSEIVRQEMEDGSVTWLMPASKRPNFFWFFSLFWLAITGTFSVAMLFAEPSDDTSQTVMWLMPLFMLPFWAVGLGMAYWGLRVSFMESIFAVHAEEVLLLQKFFGKVKKKSVSRSELKRVELSEAYRQNDRPVYALALFDDQGKLLSFGSRLKEDDKRWLLGQIRESLGLDRKKRRVRSSVKSDSGYGAAIAVQNYSDLEEFDEKGFKLTRIGDEGFRIEREYSIGKWLFVGGLLALIGVVLFANGGLEELKNLDDEWEWTDLIDAIFMVMPLLGALVAFIVFVVLVIAGKHFHWLVERFEFSNDSLLVRKGKKMELGNETRYQRSDFGSVKRTQSGHVNNDPRYSVELKGKKNLKVHGFLKGEIANTLEEWLEVWLEKR